MTYITYGLHEENIKFEVWRCDERFMYGYNCKFTEYSLKKWNKNFYLRKVSTYPIPSFFSVIDESAKGWSELKKWNRTLSHCQKGRFAGENASWRYNSVHCSVSSLDTDRKYDTIRVKITFLNWWNIKWDRLRVQ